MLLNKFNELRMLNALSSFTAYAIGAVSLNPGIGVNDPSTII